MSRATVALVRCNDYDPDAVYAALQRGCELLGGLERFVRSGERLLLKPNILAGDGPAKAVTTHPAVLAACARLFQRGGASVAFGDSPGLEGETHAARTAGLLEAGLRSGATLGDFATSRPLANAAGGLVKSFPIAQAVHECDGLINLPKMKTHQLTRLTGAMKNLFGCIPGSRKSMYHVQFPDVQDFSRFLAELNLSLRPRLHIMDGIVAMEGNGPRSGDPRAMRVLILSDDPVAVDATFCRLVAMNPAYVPTVLAGQHAGLGQYAEDAITYVGDGLESFIQPDFRLIRKPVYGNATWAYFNTLKKLLVPRPFIEEAKCVHCGMCVQACPVPEKAVHFSAGQRGQPPVYDYDRCIRCYCCHEMCPHRAIAKKTPLLGQVLHLA
jgi:uncharacterized protein (DUF362 family)/Pyruvate/2-oxoacid:ferredoxin oxidoreductase delta subunit